jgi:hypothetical protein
MTDDLATEATRIIHSWLAAHSSGGPAEGGDED